MRQDTCIPKEDINSQGFPLAAGLFEELEAKCNSCDLLQGLEPDKEYIITIWYPLAPVALAVRQYNNPQIYAVWSGKIPPEQLSIFGTFMHAVKRHKQPGDRIIVFSPETLASIEKYNYGQSISVLLKD